MTQVLRNIRQLFDLDANPAVIARHLGALAETRPGLRVPGAFDNFELAVRAIMGQQVSVKGATTLMTRYVTEYGDSIETPFAGLNRITPSAAKIAKRKPEELAVKIGIPLKRAACIIDVAKAIANKSLVLDQMTDVQSVIVKLPGNLRNRTVDSSVYCHARFAFAGCFSSWNVGIRKAMQETNTVKLIAASEPWRPWRYAAMHLWQSLPVQTK